MSKLNDAFDELNNYAKDLARDHWVETGNNIDPVNLLVAALWIKMHEKKEVKQEITETPPYRVGIYGECMDD